MTPLRYVLQTHGITDLFVVGVGFDGCVKATAIDAAEFGYSTFLIKEGVNDAARSPEKREKTLRDLETAGVEVISMDSAELKEVIESGRNS